MAPRPIPVSTPQPITSKSSSRRYKQRLKDHHKSRREPVRHLEAASYVITPAPEEEDEAAGLNPVVVAEADARLPELSVGEAVMQLDISNVPFLLFRNGGHGGLNWSTGARTATSAGSIPSRQLDQHRQPKAGSGTMTLDDIIDKQSVLANLKAQNKKQLLQELSQAMATRVAIDHRVIFETLLKREKLGSTGIGQGIAIPHGKVPTLNRVYGLFARLATPVDFESVDGQPVDLVFVLLAPDHAGADHLKALAKISRLLRDPVMVAEAARHGIGREPLCHPHGAGRDGVKRHRGLASLPRQCTLIGMSSCSKALPTAASRLSEIETGVPSAWYRQKSLALAGIVAWSPSSFLASLPSISRI